MAIGTMLVERGLVEADHLEQALLEHRRTGERLDQVIVRLGFMSSRGMLTAIADQLAMPVVDLADVEVAPEVLESLPPRLVFRQQCVPIAIQDGALWVATCDPFELTALDELRLIAGRPVEIALAEEQDIRKFIRANYGVAGDTLEELSGDDSDDGAAIEADGDELDQAQEASVIKLVNDLLIEAIRERATDVHIEPYEDHLNIRYRIDGVLTPAGVPASVHRFRHAISSRLKIMANLNIAEKRRPQDGRITLRHRGHEFDLRVSVIPMLHGTGIVLRVLRKDAAMFELERLGMNAELLASWDSLIARPHGILLATGPTGSGKSTTLYASLSRIVSDEVKAITVEDPVEYHVEGVNQIPVNRAVGLDFSAGLRAILRHDPDIVMIGEIRDHETAEAAVQASLTGHLVFSTLHTNDAPGAMTRLLDMGVEPFLVSSSVEGVLAQRLVRTLCPECRRPVDPGRDLPPQLALGPGEVIYEAVGCRECRQTGFRGRVGIYELLVVDPEIRELVMSRSNAGRIGAYARDHNKMRTLRDDGFLHVRAGTTTISEVLRVTR